MSLDNDAGALGRILASLPGFVVVVDAHGAIRYLNRVQPGFDRDRVIGTQAVALFVGEHAAVFEANLAQVLETGRPGRYEVMMRSPSGGSTWYQSDIFPYRENGTVVGAVIVAHDVTELRTAMKELEDLRRLLPICSWCGKIRNDSGKWETVEAFLGKQMDTQVTHGMCTDCFGRHMRELGGGGTGRGGAA